MRARLSSALLTAALASNALGASDDIVLFASRAEMTECYAVRHTTCGHVPRGGFVTKCMLAQLDNNAQNKCVVYFRTARRADGTYRPMRLARAGAQIAATSDEVAPALAKTEAPKDSDAPDQATVKASKPNAEATNPSTEPVPARAETIEQVRARVLADIARRVSPTEAQSVSSGESGS